MRKRIIKAVFKVGALLTIVMCFQLISTIVHSLLLRHKNSSEKDIRPILKLPSDDFLVEPILEETISKGPLETKTTWESGWKSWIEEQERRKELVKNVCQKGSSQVQSRRDRYRSFVQNKGKVNAFFVCDKYKAIYCSIPKNSCTSWRKMWRILGGKVDTTNINDLGMAHLRDARILNQGLTEEELLGKFENYTKVIVVRHPIERLISAYFDKIHKKEGASQQYFQRQVLPFVKKTRQSANFTNILYSEFINFIISLRGKGDPHWTPFDTRCYPCDLDFDVIVKFDTFAEDNERFLRLIKAPEDLHFPPEKRKVDPNFVDPYLKSLTPDQIDGIYKYFGKDFEMFGYDKP